MSSVEMQLRKHFGKYKWFRRLTKALFGWYWRKDPLKEARKRLENIEPAESETGR